jgi:hypothetical protein
LRHFNPIRIPHTPCFKNIVILFSHLLLDLPDYLFPCGISTKISYAIITSPERAALALHFICRFLNDFLLLLLVGYFCDALIIETV